MTPDELTMALKTIAWAEGPGPTHAGKPKRWWDVGNYRCVNEHVSTLKSSSGCRRCAEPTYLTFPEDSDGPLRAPLVPGTGSGTSILLNRYLWRLAEALGLVEEGATAITIEPEAIIDAAVVVLEARGKEPS